jgi:serine/threonine protein kinase
MASALAFVHSWNIIHGDIGIHNILFCQEPQQRLILADFGGSRIDGSKFLSWPSARYRMEGREYRPSELYEPTVQHDTFALGMVLYEIQTWAQAWVDKDHPEVLSLIRQEKFPDLESVPFPELREVIGRCWQRQYLRGSDLSSDLEELL